MRYLLDSHVIYWAVYDPTRLTPRVKSLLEDRKNELLVSHGAVWELLNKAGRGGLSISPLPVTEIFHDLVALGVTLLPISMDHIIAAASLPDIHRDPFDRLYVAQALAEDVTLITGDPDIWPYPVPTVWK